MEAPALLGEIEARGTPPEAEPAERGLRQALALAEQLGRRPNAARCRLALGRLFRQTGRTEPAREHLRAAVAMFGDMAMGRWLEEAEAGWAAIG